MDGNTTRPRAAAAPPGGPHPPTYHASHDPRSPARYSTTLVHALADVMGRDVTDVDAALADSVDPVALDVLFRRRGPAPDGHVAFSVDGYRVTAYSGGQIVITPPADPAFPAGVQP